MERGPIAAIQTLPGWKPYRNAILGESWIYTCQKLQLKPCLTDTMKLYTKAHGAKVAY